MTYRITDSLAHTSDVPAYGPVRMQYTVMVYRNDKYIGYGQGYSLAYAASEARALTKQRLAGDWQGAMQYM